MTSNCMVTRRHIRECRERCGNYTGLPDGVSTRWSSVVRYDAPKVTQCDKDWSDLVRGSFTDARNVYHDLAVKNGNVVNVKPKTINPRVPVRGSYSLPKNYGPLSLTTARHLW